VRLMNRLRPLSKAEAEAAAVPPPPAEEVVLLREIRDALKR
jgi:large conductance mechanosensitive channel